MTEEEIYEMFEWRSSHPNGTAAEYLEFRRAQYALRVLDELEYLSREGLGLSTEEITELMGRLV